MAQEIGDIPSSTNNCPEISDENNEKSNAVSRKVRACVYSTMELEALRFANVSDQKRRWNEIYRSLNFDVMKEYDELRARNNHKNSKKKKITKKKMKNDDDPSKIMMEAPYKELNNGVTVEDNCVFPVLDVGNGVSNAQDIDAMMSKGKWACENDRYWSYSRSEMEALRSVNVRELGRGLEVYHNLDSDIVEEFDGLRVADDCMQQQSQNDGWQQSAGKTNDTPQHCGKILAVKATEGPDIMHVLGVTVNCNGDGTCIQEPLDEHEDFNDEYESSSDECESIQRTAFFVEGKPDFESGPPLDGLEYLRRVRWEAAQIPKVKVVKPNSSKLPNEQTAYMPSIPEIPKCPPNLLPSKDWENAFLADFSELRHSMEAISVHEQCINEVGKGPGKQSDGHEQLRKNPPTLTAVLGMDAVSRAAALRKSISSFESASVLSRDDCRWMFALCATVDTPLHADTCASLRCLLRKCSGLLALKSETDDDVAMLSVLVAITGKYFGQLDDS